MSYFFKQNSSTDHRSEFREIADRISEIASKDSLELKGYHSSELPLFSALSSDKQAEVLKELRVFLNTMERASAHGDSLSSADRSVWHALVTLGMVPPSEMFDRFKQGDVVEIYDLKGIQVWRNLNFLKICSYTLEEMHSLEWADRYVRDSAKTEECMQKMGMMLMGQTPEIYDCNISEHILEETSSVDRFVLEARHNWAARLKNNQGEVVGCLITSQVKLLGKSLSAWKTRPALHVVQTRPQLDL
jgi:hypothetical protein